MKWRKKNQFVNYKLKGFASYVDVDYKIIKTENKESLFLGYERIGYDCHDVIDICTSPYDYIYRFPLAYLTWHCLPRTVDEKIESEEFKELFPELSVGQINYYRKKAKRRLKDSWCKGTGVSYRK